MTSRLTLPSARTCALAAIVMFAPVAISIVLFKLQWWQDYPGILFHLAMFLLVARLPAPDWAKSAGYGWLLLDVTVGVMSLNHVPGEITMPIRLGGHIFAGMWVVSASLPGSKSVKWIGVLTGLWLSGFSFVSPFVTTKALGPASLLMLVWLGLIAWQNGCSGSGEASRGA